MADSRYQYPDSGECDLVMEGGVTSGVVYPQAVLALAEKCRFRYVGGGSVGAIAAALAAAAELGRERGGFERLENEHNRFLTRKGFLLQLFRPSESTRPLMNTLLGLAGSHGITAGREEKGSGRAAQWITLRRLRSAAGVLIRNNPGAFLRGAVAGVASGIVLGLISGMTLAAMLLFALALGGLAGLIWVLRRLWRILTRTLPSENFYGLCTGHDPGADGTTLLTDWLSDVLDRVAGKSPGEPLTFGDLGSGTAENGSEDEPAIALRMLTANLNHNEPYVFPTEHSTLLFREKDMRKLFPDYVVEHMKRGTVRPGNVAPPEGYWFLPAGEALPVIVPVRMAISFPVLLSAVPLYTIREPLRQEDGTAPYRLREDELQRNWFSDGGICSNFPIHFFDAWFPRRPTFGINLTSLSGEGGSLEFSASGAAHTGTGATDPLISARRSADPAEPWLPRPEEPGSPEWTEFSGLLGLPARSSSAL